MAQLKVSLENIIPLTEARDHFSQIVTEVQQDKLYVLTKGGKPAVAIIDVKYLESISGGTVKPEHIESEIQKDPAKVGRTPMIKHETPPEPPLVFPQPEPPKPAEPAPIKINFQPASAPITPPMPTPPPPTSAPAPIIPPPAVSTPPLTTPPPTPITPPPTINPNPTTTTIPVSSGSVIDVVPAPEETVSPPPAPRVSQDDQAGPAQYAGESNGTDDLKDMEI